MLVSAAIATGTGALAMNGLPTELLGRAVPPALHLEADPAAVAVVQGDTLVLAGQSVHLRGIYAPSRGEICPGQIDCGRAAAGALADLVRGRKVECALEGSDPAGRPYGDCKAGGTDLAEAIVARGWARAIAPEFADVESRARRQRAGLWRDGSGI